MRPACPPGHLAVWLIRMWCTPFKRQDYLMLTHWLPDTENKLPPNASHQVGVGAFVLNERREVLVVQVGRLCARSHARVLVAVIEHC